MWMRRSVASSTRVSPWSKRILWAMRVLGGVGGVGAFLELEIAAVGRGAAVAQEVLGTGDHGEGIAESIALQAEDFGLAELGDELRIFGEAFVGAAPTFVLRAR